MIVRRYACSFTDAAGATRMFWIEAASFDHAADLLHDIAITGQVDGELIEEGEGSFFPQIGIA